MRHNVMSNILVSLALLVKGQVVKTHEFKVFTISICISVRCYQLHDFQLTAWLVSVLLEGGGAHQVALVFPELPDW